MKELVVRNNTSGLIKKIFLILLFCILVAVCVYKNFSGNISEPQITPVVQPKAPPRIRYVGYLCNNKLLRAILIVDNKFFEVSQGSSLNNLQFELITPTYLVVNYNQEKFKFANEFARREYG